ncbi:MAG: hypothetical protein ACK4KT_08700 [Thermaurantimonas sp.]
MKIKDFIKIYAAILAAHTAAQYVSGDFSLLFFTKLLIPLSLLLYNFYYNSDKLKNALLTSSFGFFLLGNVLMLIKPTYDPCRFETPILSYSAAFAFLAVLALLRAKWSIKNALVGLSVAIVNTALSYLYVLNGLSSDAIVFYIFVLSFAIMSFTSFLNCDEPKKKAMVVLGVISISISNHILGFCTFKTNNTDMVPVAMLLYGISLFFFMLGYIDTSESEIQTHMR